MKRAHLLLAGAGLAVLVGLVAYASGESDTWGLLRASNRFDAQPRASVSSAALLVIAPTAASEPTHATDENDARAQRDSTSGMVPEPSAPPRVRHRSGAECGCKADDLRCNMKCTGPDPDSRVEGKY
jgi:hypothetical protein